MPEVRGCKKIHIGTPAVDSLKIWTELDGTITCLFDSGARNKKIVNGAPYARPQGTARPAQTKDYLSCHELLSFPDIFSGGVASGQEADADCE